MLFDRKKQQNCYLFVSSVILSTVHYFIFHTISIRISKQSSISFEMPFKNIVNYTGQRIAQNFQKKTLLTQRNLSQSSYFWLNRDSVIARLIYNKPNVGKYGRILKNNPLVPPYNMKFSKTTMMCLNHHFWLVSIFGTFLPAFFKTFYFVFTEFEEITT
jgi:hypothetical protein